MELSFLRNKNGNIRQRFFVEAGAYDGEELSNTLYLEIRYNWTGLLVEPNPDYHTSLVGKRRNTWILPHCLSPKKYPVVVDFDATGYLGGIINNENSKNIVPADVIMGTSSHSSDPIWRRPLKVNVVIKGKSSHTIFFQTFVHILTLSIVSCRFNVSPFILS